MRINVTPEIDGFVIYCSEIFIKHGIPYIKSILDKIKDIQKNGDLILENNENSVPMYKVQFFTFGGVMVLNKSFDIKRM